MYMIINSNSFNTKNNTNIITRKHAPPAPDFPELRIIEINQNC